MKIAISGKGGVGKTLLAFLLSTVFVESGYSVIAIDADPDANLAAALGFVPYDQAVVEADLANLPLLDTSQQIAEAAEVNMPTPMSGEKG